MPNPNHRLDVPVRCDVSVAFVVHPVICSLLEREEMTANESVEMVDDGEVVS